MADSRRSAGGVAPRSRPSRVTPYGPSKVSHRRSIQYDPPRRGTKGISTPYDAPAIGPSYVAATPYDLPANLRRSTPYDPPTTGTPCDPPAIGCHTTPPHDSPAIGCLNNPCDSPASSPSYSDLCLNNTPSPVSDSEITLDYDGRQCFICDGKRLHSSVLCPCLVLAAQLDVVKDNPPKEWEYYRYVVRNEWEGMDGYGVGFYDPPKKGDVERGAAEAMRQYKDGMNMIRMTGLPENNRDPERLQAIREEIWSCGTCGCFS